MAALILSNPVMGCASCEELAGTPLEGAGRQADADMDVLNYVRENLNSNNSGKKNFIYIVGLFFYNHSLQLEEGIHVRIPAEVVSEDINSVNRSTRPEDLLTVFFSGFF